MIGSSEQAYVVVVKLLGIGIGYSKATAVATYQALCNTGVDDSKIKNVLASKK